MSEPLLSRRRVLRVGGGLSALLGTAGLAGCAGLLASGLPTRSGSDVLRYAPEHSVAVADVDVASLLADESLRTSIDANLDLISRAIEDVPPSTGAALDRTRGQIGLDPRSLSRALGFVVVPPAEADEPTAVLDPLANTDRGAVLWSDWPVQAVRQALTARAGQVREDTHRGFRRFTLEQGDATVLAVGVVPPDRYVVGGSAGVEAGLAVAEGSPSASASAADSSLGPALAAARQGPIRIGIAPSRSADRSSGFGDPVVLLAGKIDAVYGGMYRTGDRRGLELLLAAGDRYDAEDVYESVQSVMALARSGQILPTVEPVLSQATTTRDGTTVEVRYEASVDAFAVTLLSVAAAGLQVT